MSKEARITALEVLYAADATQAEPDLDGVGARAGRLARGVWEHLAELDEELGSAARGWRIGRMPTVDRAILRLALYELRHTETPPAVVISEAVTMAKAYSTQRSGAFVNGVLGALLEATSDSS